MSVISINSRRFLGEYIDETNREGFPEPSLFIGILLSLILQIVYCLFGGIIPVLAFAFTALVGSGLGVAMNRYLPFEIPSCISGTIPQAPSIDDQRKERAA